MDPTEELAAPGSSWDRPGAAIGLVWHATMPLMRTTFGLDDDDAYFAARKELLAAYEADPAGPTNGDTFVADMMLTYKWSYAGGRITDWRARDLEELLLDFFPRKVALGPEAEQIERIESLRRATHPRTGDVLRALGQHHPSQAVAKAARKTAFQRSSSH